MTRPARTTSAAATHTLGSLYEALEPAKARALAKRLEIYYTPRHGFLAQHGSSQKRV